MRLGQYSLKSLVGMALQYQQCTRDEHRYWSIVTHLHLSASAELVQCAQRLYQSSNWHKRLLAVDIFNQLLIKNDQGVYIEYAVEISHKILSDALDDAQLAVVKSAICGLGHRPTVHALSKLVSYATHEDAFVRYRVASALGRYADEVAIDALVCLAADQDVMVRDWATFSLGSMLDIDSPIIREALWRNIDDKDVTVAGEALVGLAIRKEQRLLDVLKVRLVAGCSEYVISAADLMEAPCLQVYLDAIGVEEM